MGEREPRKEASQRSESILAQEFVEPILDKAKEYLRAYGQLEPAALFVRLESGEQAVIPLELPSSSEERQAYFAVLGLSIRLAGHRISEALFVSEVWFVEPEEHKKTIDIAPSQHQNRKEAIAIFGRDAQGERFTQVLQPFGRGEQNQPVLEQVAVVKYDVPPEAGLHSVGLLDYLFD